MATRYISAICGLLALGEGLAACAHPCRELSMKVCLCEPTDEARRACVARVDRLASQDRTTDARMQQQCSQHLAECTCQALAAGDRQACGLAAEAPE